MSTDNEPAGTRLVSYSDATTSAVGFSVTRFAGADSVSPGSTNPDAPSLIRWPGWAAVLLAFAAAVGGLALGGALFPISVTFGCLLAALLAERSAFFAVAVQPPLITAIVVAGAVFLGQPLLDAATQLASTFPYLAGTMVAVIAILFVRARVSPARTSS